jgi:hypothetical protein
VASFTILCLCEYVYVWYFLRIRVVHRVHTCPYATHTNRHTCLPTHERTTHSIPSADVRHKRQLKCQGLLIAGVGHFCSLHGVAHPGHKRDTEIRLQVCVGVSGTAVAGGAVVLNGCCCGSCVVVVVFAEALVRIGTLEQQETTRYKFITHS